VLIGHSMRTPVMPEYAPYPANVAAIVPVDGVLHLSGGRALPTRTA
jgi:hypothetical protein